MIVKASPPAANKGAGLDCDGKKRRVRTVGVAGGGDPPGVAEGDAGRDFAAGGERTGRTMVGTRCTSHVDSGHEPSLLAGGAATPGRGRTHLGRGMIKLTALQCPVKWTRMHGRTEKGATE